MLKNLKKEVIIEVEEQTTQLNSSTQRVEEPESEQQKKTDEDELLKFQRQNLDDAVNTLNEDANQGVGECILEQE